MQQNNYNNDLETQSFKDYKYGNNDQQSTAIYNNDYSMNSGMNYGQYNPNMQQPMQPPAYSNYENSYSCNIDMTYL